MYLELYILGLLTVNSILVLWFFSPLSSSIGKYLLKKDDIYSLDNLLDLIALKSNFFATLLGCWICLSFWLSLLVGTILTICTTLPPFFPVVAFATYPGILYAIKQLYR